MKKKGEPCGVSKHVSHRIHGTGIFNIYPHEWLIFIVNAFMDSMGIYQMIQSDHSSPSITGHFAFERVT